MSAKFRHERARVAVLSRYRDPSDPELIAARTRMREEVLVDAVAKALTNAMPLNSALLNRIMGLLASSEESA
ncbi:hypothetical protein [Mycobacterium sp. P7213]|uniref:hypothetical protein n=1 Tax=Mycobacterium sp. P7213 TaxID=2478465 RepID=UPI000F62B703|nr:hypothetical protein [Mycobacterium sp. P7213]